MPSVPGRLAEPPAEGRADGPGGRAPRLLGVFAHPDDEVFCAGGSFARYAAAGAEVMVLSATRGEAGQIRDAAIATRATLPAVREAELRRSCELLGVRHVRCLDHRDGTLADQPPDALAAEAAAVIDEFAPDVVITFGDDGAYGHPDHVAISAAATAAVKAAGAAGPRLFHSHFPRSRLLLRERLARWLVELGNQFRGSVDFALALSLFAQESTTMRLASDDVDIRWYPPGFAIVEQGEPSTALYLVLSGEAEAVREEPDGTRRTLGRLGTGEFFGEIGVATRNPRSAHVVAASSTTCLVLTADEPSGYAGRGADAALVGAVAGEDGTGQPPVVGSAATTVIDVRDHVDAKVAAIAAYRSQYPIRPEMFPPGMLADMFGTEHFVRISPPPQPETDLLG
jgi:LmbE family N-acetylglucosaminyl deacetylase